MADKTKKLQLDTLRTKMSKADLHLKKGAVHLVFGEGSPDARVIFVGEAPGKNEDEQGRPFVGSAGKILDQMLHSIKLDRADVYITSILKYRPPGNRNPRMEEIVNHTPYLVDQIRIIKPKLIVPLGNFAARFVLSTFDIKKMQDVPAISMLHGKVKKIEFEGLDFSVMALYHPAAVLYNRTLEKVLEKDFRLINVFLHSS